MESIDRHDGARYGRRRDSRCMISLTPGRTLLLLVLAAMTVCAVAPATFAQSPIHLRGDIVDMSSFYNRRTKALRIRLRDGRGTSIALAYNFQTVEIGPADPSRLVPGTRVGIVAEPIADGGLSARAVLVYFDDYFGNREGEFPWDLPPGSTMINATVGMIDVGDSARTLTLRHSGGETTIVVSDGTPVAAAMRTGRSVLKPGTHVFINATTQRDGTITAARIYYGSMGFVPPL